MWQEKLKDHIKLSETHAENYDNDYGTFITKDYMLYEKERLNLALDFLDEERRNLAVDIGCGTGRCTFDLSRYFKKTVGIDFSPKMLAIANCNAGKEQISNVDFVLRDVNTYGLGEYSQKVSLLNFAFGMGSFFEDIDYLITEIKRVLADDGIIYITFYNKESFVCKLSSYVDMGMSAKPILESEQLLVDGIRIPCKFYFPDEIRKIFSVNFKEISFLTYPTILPLIKEEVFSFQNILNYCKKIDKEISDAYNGYYISALYQNKYSDNF